jgi:anti-sigma regulatory factor (Ser/Thr protein kinase)
MTTAAFAIADSSSSASAPRQHAGRLALKLGFSEERAGRVVLVTSELATNIAKHAAGGEILIQAVNDTPPGIEVFAIDKGPGLPPDALRHGYSTTGSLGAGLGVVQRQADHFEITAAAGAGTVAVARVWQDAPPAERCVPFSGICVPRAGESVCGDAWGCWHHGSQAAVIVVDGLGHGPHAAAAATAAMDVFTRRGPLAPVDLIEEIHLALRASRGAAVAVTMIDGERGLVRFAGVGNVLASMMIDERTRRMFTSHNGTAGVAIRRLQEFTYPLRRDSILIMQSDGLGTHWNPEAYDSVWRRDAALMAAMLYRDQARGRDDCTVVVGHIAAQD